jgi:hypothetical protein
MSVSFSSKQKRQKKRNAISNNGKSVNGSAPQLTPQQISVIAGILTGFFDIQTVLYNRDNTLQVLLTTNKLTDLPILGPPLNLPESDILAPVEVVVSNAGMYRNNKNK